MMHRTHSIKLHIQNMLISLTGIRGHGLLLVVQGQELDQ